jgi:2-polyprenyl-3-methyl-5-hydroxy-6-metoxy-1,4-benzoquinol methylase
MAIIEQANKHRDPVYVMGRTEAETRRLILAAEVLNPFTRRMLQDAGLEAGMRVLDIGTGAGDVALVAAELVGPGGRVVGVDANPQILTTAAARARAAALDHVSFAAGDCRQVTQGGPFDAVVGRLVLMYLADPVDALRLLADRLGPGGIIAFQEFNFTPESLRPSPPTPLWQQSWSWIVETIRRAQIPAEVGFGLRRAFLNAGLPEPELRLESIVAGGPDSVGYEWMAESVRSMLPLIVMSGVATEAEIGIDTLASRLRAETTAAGGVVKAPDMVSAWTHRC